MTQKSSLSEKRRALARRIGRTLHLIIFAVIISTVLVLLCGSHGARVGFLDLRVALKPTLERPGRTEFVLNPLGQVSASTHQFPSRLVFSVERVHGDMVADLALNRINPQSFLKQTQRRSIEFFRAFLSRFFLLSIIGGIIGAALSRRFLFGNVKSFFVLLVRDVLLRTILPGAACGFCFAAGILYFTFAHYDASAFRRPQYQGMLSEMPEIWSYVQNDLSKKDELKDQIGTVASNLAQFHIKLNQMNAHMAVQGNHVKILHISDLHNNPFAVPLVRALVQILRPDIILNTGDITDHGAPEELKMLSGIISKSPPQFFITGNHDSVEVQKLLSETKGVTVLDGNVIETHGLRILGYGDPKARQHFPKDAVVDTEGLRRLAKTIRSDLRRMKRKPQILMVHDPAVAEKFLGAMPLIVTGHSHETRIRGRGPLARRNSVLVNTGTTGASGVRYFKNFERPFYSAAFITVTAGRVAKVEQVSILYMDNMEHDFAIYTKTF